MQFVLPKLTSCIRYILIFTLIIVTTSITFFYDHLNLRYFQINDALLELLQTFNFDTSAFSFFVPSYPGARATPIESIFPYLNMTTYRLFNVSSLENSGLAVSYAALVLMVLICFHILEKSKETMEVKNKSLQNFIVIIFLVLLGTSSLIGHISTTLTRNCISLLCSSLSMMGYVYFQQDQKKQGSGIIFISFIAGVLSYSSFKAFFPAFFLSWFLITLVKTKSLKEILWPIGLTFICALAFILLLSLGGSNYELGFLRGDYVFGHIDFVIYAKRYFYTALMPIYATNDNSFYMAEVVHVSYLKPMLSTVLSAFFIVGVGVGIIRFKNDIWGFALLSWFIGCFFFAFGGPSVKYNYVNFLYPMFIAFKGIDFSVQYLNRFSKFKNKFFMASFIILISILSIQQEWRHLFNTIPESDLRTWDINYGYTMGEALREIKYEKNDPIIGLSTHGVDGNRYLLRDEKNIKIFTEEDFIPENFWNTFETIKKEFPLAENMYVVCQDIKCPFLKTEGLNCKETLNKEFKAIHYSYFHCLIPKKSKS